MSVEDIRLAATLAVRAHIEGTALVPPGGGHLPGKGDRTSNHVRWGVSWRYAGGDQAGVLNFHEVEKRRGFESFTDDENHALSHGIQHVGPVMCNVAIALERKDEKVLDESALWMRKWLTDYELHRVPAKKQGFLSKLFRRAPEVRPLHFAGARMTPFVDQSKPMAELVALLVDGTRTTHDLGTPDRTCVWAALRPGVLEFLLPRLQGRSPSKDLPATRYPYRLSKYADGHLGMYVGTLADMYAPAKWVLSDYRSGRVMYGNVPSAHKLDHGNNLIYPAVPETYFATKGVAVYTYPVAPGGPAPYND